jgi:hypothetical protein
MLAGTQILTLWTQATQIIVNCALLGYYAASSGNFLLRFQDNILVTPSGVKNPKRNLAVERVYIGKSVGSGKFSIAWCQQKWLVGVGGRE